MNVPPGRGVMKRSGVKLPLVVSDWPGASRVHFGSEWEPDSENSFLHQAIADDGVESLAIYVVNMLDAVIVMGDLVVPGVFLVVDCRGVDRGYTEDALVRIILEVHFLGHLVREDDLVGVLVSFVLVHRARDVRRRDSCPGDPDTLDESYREAYVQQSTADVPQEIPAHARSAPAHGIVVTDFVAIGSTLVFLVPVLLHADRSFDLFVCQSCYFRLVSCLIWRPTSPGR